MLKARSTVRLAPILVLLLAACACGKRDRRPSIIVINVDTLRADFLGSYGFRGDVSRNLDRLAEQSFRFTNCYSQAPWTKPSVATLFTSLHPEVHGLTDHEGAYWGDETRSFKSGVLGEEAWTLAEALRDEGFATAAFVANPWLNSAYGFSQGFEHYDQEGMLFRATLDDLAREALRWLDGRQRSAPFFLYLHPMDVHAPYDAPRADFNALRRSSDVRSAIKLEPDRIPDMRWSNLETRPKWAGDELRRTVEYWRARYASGVRAFDRRLGNFLEALEQRGLLDEVLLIVTSDHGEELYEHGGWSHGRSLYRHQLHVPLLVRLPGGRQGGSAPRLFFDQLDLMPTLLSMAGGEIGARAQGQDLSAVFAGRNPSREAQSFAGANQAGPGWHALTTAKYKLIVNVRDESEELFDLVSDPQEQRNLARREPAILKRMKDRLSIHLRDSAAAGRFDPRAEPISDEVRQRLEALGYLD